jgi:hypothetical protein
MLRVRKEIEIPIINEDMLSDNAPDPERLEHSFEFVNRHRRARFLKGKRSRVSSRKRRH